MDDGLAVLTRQLDIAWRLARLHLDSLTTEECLWRPGGIGPHVYAEADGRWRSDWPEDEAYASGPPSIGWLTWHMGYWWSMVLNHSFGTGTLTRHEVVWPGGAGPVRDWLGGLHAEWQRALERTTAAELKSSGRTTWPIRDRPFADVVAWVNLELMKNAAEIGYARFLYATRRIGEPG